MEQQGMRPSYMPDFSKADLANRKKAFDVLYKDFIQADIDKTTALLLENGSIRFAKKAADVPGVRSLFSAIPIAGMYFGIEDAAKRSAKALETKNPVDALQATLAGAGNIPAVGNLADLVNFGIDTFRAGPKMEPAVRNGSVRLPILNR